MRNIFLSVVIVAALVVAGIGGTLADWVEDDYGQFCWDAGYLNLKVDVDGTWLTTLATFDVDGDGDVDADDWYYSDDLGELICQSNIEPTDSGKTSLSFHIEGDSTITGAKVTVGGTIDSLENGMVEPEITAGDTTAIEGELDDFMNIKLWIELDNDGTCEAGDVVLYDGPIAGLIDCIENNPEQLQFELVKCTVYYLVIEWELPGYDVEPNVNQCMTDSLGGNVLFTAEAIHFPTQPNPPILPD